MKKIYTGTLLFISAFSNAQTTTPRIPLIEGLTSNTCGPCASWNGFYGPVIENNLPNEPFSGQVAVVKYQMDWPSPGTDPSFNDDGDTRRGFYGTSGIPDWYVDGISSDGTQSQIDTRKTTDAQLKIDASYTLSGNTITVNVQFIPLADLGSGYRLYIALANKSYNYSGGTNGETNFKHVLRKMLPSGGGIYLPALYANDTTLHTETYTFTVAGGTPAQSSYDLWNQDIEVIAWVQRTTSGKPVMNAAIAGEGALAVEEGDKDDFGMILFPNPVNEMSVVMFDASTEERTLIEVYNNLGQVVFIEDAGYLRGRQKFKLNTSGFAAGLYYVKVRSGNKTATRSLMVARD